MAKLDLLHKLQTIDSGETDETSHIQYQEYTVIVEGHDQDISIPIRECAKFEKTLEEYEELSKHDLRKLMREFRGLIKR